MQSTCKICFRILQICPTFTRWDLQLDENRLRLTARRSSLRSTYLTTRARYLSFKAEMEQWVDVINKFQSSMTSLLWTYLPWLAKTILTWLATSNHSALLSSIVAMQLPALLWNLFVTSIPVANLIKFLWG